jgi:hypothetical protein
MTENLTMIGTKIRTLQPEVPVSDAALNLIPGLGRNDFTRKWNTTGVWMSEGPKWLHVIWHDDGSYGLYERSEFEVLEQPCVTCNGSGRIAVESHQSEQK